MRQAAESVRRYADTEVDPVAMLWRQRSRQRRRSLQTAAVALALLAALVAVAVLVARAPRQPEVIAPPPRPPGRVAATIRPAPGAIPAGGRCRRRPGLGRRGRRQRLPRGPQAQPRDRHAAAAGRVPVGGGRAGRPVAGQRGGRHGQPGRSPHRQDPATVRVGSVAAGPDPHEEQFGVAVDGNTVWVARLHTDVVRLNWAARSPADSPSACPEAPPTTSSPPAAAWP
jgi:hypothetical protein